MPDDLRVVGVEILFHAKPGSFAIGQGSVIAPVVSELVGAQEVLDVRADPAPARLLHVDGTTVIAWDYAGTLHREMHFTAMALVRRAPAAQVTAPASPSFLTLRGDALDDARLTAHSLGEHGLQRCKAFAAWVTDVAGPPPYTDQLVRIAQRVRAGISASPQTEKRADDVCAAIRTGRFSEHYAQVATVMALRELGAPAYGLASAEPPHTLVATYVDGPGWITLDVMRPDGGFTSGGPAFVTKAPLVGTFEAARDGFWSPAAAAYRPSQMGVTGFSWTSWQNVEGAGHEDATVTFDRPLAEACR